MLKTRWEIFLYSRMFSNWVCRFFCLFWIASSYISHVRIYGSNSGWTSNTDWILRIYRSILNAALLSTYFVRRLDLDCAGRWWALSHHSKCSVSLELHPNVPTQSCGIHFRDDSRAALWIVTLKSNPNPGSVHTHFLVEIESGFCLAANKDL